MKTPASIGSTISPTIVLPTFRGAVHLPRQIESLQAQSHRDWRLLVRDDDSQDGTTLVLDRFARADPRIEFITDGDGRLGVVGNFSRLLERALSEGATWVALCDQDDVWLPNKLEVQLDRIAAASPSPDEPMLLHSDLAVVDASLEPIAPSLHRLMGIRHEPSDPLPTLLIQNFVTGCTCIANRALLELALPIPSDAVMADWWLALCAASSGHIDFEPEATLLYRQHDANAVGARSLRSAVGATLRRALTLRRHDPQEFLDTLAQAAALKRRLAVRIEEAPGRVRIEASAAFVADYLSLFRERIGRMRRVVGMHRRRIRRQNGLLDAMLKLRLLTRAIDYHEPESDRHEGSSIGDTRGTRHEGEA